MFSGVKNAAGSILEAARATVSEKLGNIKAAYEANGGGIKGIAAGAMEAVKGYYTAGFTFLDNLTGGKLSSMAGKVGEGMQKIKDKISGSISWFRESGKRYWIHLQKELKVRYLRRLMRLREDSKKSERCYHFRMPRQGLFQRLHYLDGVFWKHSERELNKPKMFQRKLWSNPLKG